MNSTLRSIYISLLINELITVISIIHYTVWYARVYYLCTPNFACALMAFVLFRAYGYVVTLLVWLKADDVIFTAKLLPFVSVGVAVEVLLAVAAVLIVGMFLTVMFGTPVRSFMWWIAFLPVLVLRSVSAVLFGLLHVWVAHVA